MGGRTIVREFWGRIARSSRGGRMIARTSANAQATEKASRFATWRGGAKFEAPRSPGVMFTTQIARIYKPVETGAG
jgi:hypothetical protein